MSTYAVYRRHDITLETAKGFDSLRQAPIAEEKTRLFWWVWRACRCSEEKKRSYQTFGHLSFQHKKSVRVGGPQSQSTEEAYKQISCMSCSKECWLDFDDLELYVETWNRLFYIQEIAEVDTARLGDVHKLESIQGQATAYMQLRKATEEETMRYYGYKDFRKHDELNL